MRSSDIHDSFHAKWLQQNLATMPPDMQLAFGLLVAERLFPTLEAYSRMKGGDESSRVRAILDEFWAALEAGRLDKSWLHTVAEEVLQLRPETEDNPSPLSSYALDATGATWEVIQAAITGDASHVVAAAQISFEGAVLRTEEDEHFDPQNPADRRAILARRVVVAEIETQRAQVLRAKELAASGKEGIARLRRESLRRDAEGT